LNKLDVLVNKAIRSAVPGREDGECFRFVRRPKADKSSDLAPPARTEVIRGQIDLNTQGSTSVATRVRSAPGSWMPYRWRSSVRRSSPLRLLSWANVANEPHAAATRSHRTSGVSAPFTC
jgi:hypothetical protein